jgi:tRNA threonylcarbamoyladenosine biosynthesis protein TsaB
MLLALDTATKLISVALHDGDTLQAEQTWIAGNRHTSALAPTIQTMLNLCGVTPMQLTAVAVATGPGSYTGVRIGVAFAKGLAGAHKLPLIGATTHDILAKGQPQYRTSAALIAVVKAGRGRVIAQSYRWSKGEWVGRSKPKLVPWAALVELIDGKAIITGEVDMDSITALQERDDIDVTVAPAAYRMRRAGFLAEYAWEKLRAVDTDALSASDAFPAAHVIPVYVQTD